MLFPEGSANDVKAPPRPRLAPCFPNPDILFRASLGLRPDVKKGLPKKPPLCWGWRFLLGLPPKDWLGPRFKVISLMPAISYQLLMFAAFWFDCLLCSWLESIEDWGMSGNALSFTGMLRFWRIFKGVYSDATLAVSSSCMDILGFWNICVWFDIIIAIIMRFMNLLFSPLWVLLMSALSFREYAFNLCSVF